jgi:pimeloyl-ACP methyl ester carboxylesterase
MVGVGQFPSVFRRQDINTDGATIHVRVGGHGPAVVMLHGFADTGDMWVPLAAAFAAKGKLTMPALAVGGDKSFGAAMADILRFVATDVTSVVIPNSGHWLMEEQPAATVAAIRAFLNKR